MPCSRFVPRLQAWRQEDLLSLRLCLMYHSKVNGSLHRATHHLPHLVRTPVTYSQPLPAQTQPQAPLINPNLLNGLQSLLANGQKPGTPQIRQAAPELQHASHTQLSSIQNQTASTPALSSNDLIAALTKSGLLQNLPPGNPTPPAAPPSTTNATIDCAASPVSPRYPATDHFQYWHTNSPARTNCLQQRNR